MLLFVACRQVGQPHMTDDLIILFLVLTLMVLVTIMASL